MDDILDLQNTDNSSVENTSDVEERMDSTEDTILMETEDPTGLVDSINRLEGKLDQMNQLFLQKIQHTEYEDKILDQMHSELQKYKEDLYSQLVRPILLDVIEIRESIKRVGANYSSRPEDEQKIPLKTFLEYTFDIQDILDKNNISVYDSKEGDDYIPLKQKAVKKVTTSEEDKHGKIAAALSSGYEFNGKTIFPEKVSVYVYQKTEMTEGEKENG